MHSNKKIAIVPFPALGDITICLRLAQNLTTSGYTVTLYANLITSANCYFPWLKLESLPTVPDVIISEYDVILLDTMSPWVKEYLNHFEVSENILLFTAKNYSRDLPAKTFSIASVTSQTAGNFKNRAFCLDKNSAKNMIDWVDDYGRDVLGVEPESSPPFVAFQHSRPIENLVVIFPTTPNPKKNFTIKGFNKLARRLIEMKLRVEIVVMPHEKEKLQAEFENISVKSFLELAQLIEYLRTAKIVVSNDSGGGHLAAMLGIPTITITRKNKLFEWRPGYGLGNVVAPIVTFKLGGEHIWRPFISIKKIENIIKNILCNN